LKCRAREAILAPIFFFQKAGAYYFSARNDPQTIGMAVIGCLCLPWRSQAPNLGASVTSMPG
jgi:hypothetical protein